MNKPKTLSIVVPARDERRRLPALLQLVENEGPDCLRPAGMSLAEVIVADDGSTDGTAELVETYPGLQGRLRLVRLPRHRGKGAAAHAGALAAASDYLLLMDADMSTPLGDVRDLAAALAQGFDVAIGSRALPGSRLGVRQPRYRELMGKTFNVALRLLTGVPFHDTQCGFKLFRRDAARRLFELQTIDGFAYDAELCVNARRLGVRVAEVPVRWSHDPDTRVHLVTSSARMALDLIRIAWFARRPARSDVARS